MSEDLQCQRYYVLERISELREQIPQTMQAMVVFRARIEKYRQTDLSAAHDTYDALRRVRDDLTQALSDAQPLLMELESYALAAMAGQLLRGFKGFDLMSTGYRPVYDAVCRFAQQLPEKNTVNAATIGRLMNNVKLGYYPTDPDKRERERESKRTNVIYYGGGSMYYRRRKKWTEAKSRSFLPCFRNSGRISRSRQK